MKYSPFLPEGYNPEITDKDRDQIIIPTYCFDLDGTICTNTDGKYENAVPYYEVINKINSYYKSGHQIVIYTARGGTSGINHHELTISQLKNWGILYHKLIDQGKPHFDLFIDDKAINAETWRKENNISIINKDNYIESYLSEVVMIADKIDHNQIRLFINALQECKNNHGRLFVLGVGGSAANASHAVNDFRKIANIETYSVSENVAELTARVNDDGWNTCYSNWLKTSKLKSNDVLLIFSVGGGSGITSMNLVEAMKYGKTCNSKIISVVSRDGGKAKELSDVCVLIPVVNKDRITPHAEEWQGIILHLVVNKIV